MDLLQLPFTGAGQIDLALNINRAALGTFFAISGYHKLFNPVRHAALEQTMRQDMPSWLPVDKLCWLVPAVEFAGGASLIVGFLSPLASLALFGICFVATCTDGIKRIPAWHPLDRADVIDDVLYLPEVLYCLGLLMVTLGGPGSLSIDHLLGKLL